MKLDNYLRRIGYLQTPQNNLQTLNELHKKHIFAIPFEDLDIHLKKPLKIDINSLYEKIIVEKRGGFCYELNYLFYHLLKKIGFDCHIISSRLYDKRENLGCEFDHLSIFLKIENETFLVDVGYGSLFFEPMKIPLQINKNYIRKDRDMIYQIDKIDKKKYILSESKNGKKFRKTYAFDTTPREINEFYEQINHKQISEESYFVKNRICTIPTEEGRMTLLNNKFIKTRGNERQEHTIQSDEEFYKIVQEEFDMNVLEEKVY
ncbi:arylamine N-acetyltransferase [Bernardetia litoralis DSM 6794]|uniref:Arylamine N-acetyltransferase n=1 Tax=Bernardetia litoralis (strain ATCC 23117 / DSM 6794 / NBRC 15988 / NCIMB 1366 / Fx l1 / Sio-4) TaxID=880071 RepID=I4ANU3_BERLS|nr:arylamine N-acetyltransferase [Bernardetia litoralis]AFM05628.1 arylamine N-acetyltransferase [Bernardetia litoralis DSM 6794]